MEAVGRNGQSVLLRAWGEWAHHSVILTESTAAGVGHIGWQVAERGQVEGWATLLDGKGVDFVRVPAGTEPGQGDALRLTYPGGHQFELFFDFERANPSRPSKMLSQPTAAHGPGVGVRRLDHVNVMAPDVGAASDWLSSVLGFKLREAIQLPDGTNLATWMSVTSQVHDIAVGPDPAGRSGRLHHVAFYVDSVEAMYRAADLFREEDVPIEAGPGKHGVSQALFMYVFEPGGNRVEIFSGGYPIHDPDWRPIIWAPTEPEDFARALIWFGGTPPESFFTVGTPA
jgi:catechol 2,3-dioxygenase